MAVRQIVPRLLATILEKQFHADESLTNVKLSLAKITLMKVESAAIPRVDLVYPLRGIGQIVALESGIIEHQRIMGPRDIVPAAFVHSLAICFGLGGIFWMSLLQLVINKQ